MRALTVQQPWAWAIVHGGKTVENRTQTWKYRGPLAIHAGARWSDRGATATPVLDAFARTSTNAADVTSARKYGLDSKEASRFPRGAIIGVVDLVNVHRYAGCCHPWGENATVNPHLRRAEHEVYHLVLDNPRPITPIPYRGRLGLWIPDGDLWSAITTQLIGEATPR